MALVGRTTPDVRDVMIEGESGILAKSPPWFRPKWIPTKRRLEWPNGAIATTYTAKEPDVLRGPQHDLAWGDEFASWPYLELAWSNLQLGLRLGKRPRCVLTTTPRPLKLLREVAKDRNTLVTNGHTYDNLANLAPSFRDKIVKKYEGTRIGRQELGGELLEVNEGALWQLERDFDPYRVDYHPTLCQIVVAVDPSVSSSEDADEAGVVVVGIDDRGNLYVLEDASGRMGPDGWVAVVVDCYKKWGANLVVAESNQGGELVRTALQVSAPDMPVELVWAKQGKRARAEPVSLLYQQGRVHHVGLFPALEDQCTSWQPTDSKSPDRLDALVYGCTFLGLDGSSGQYTRQSSDDDRENAHRYRL